MLGRIVRKEYRGHYLQDTKTGAFSAEGYSVNLSKYFSFFDANSNGSVRDFSEAS